MTLSGMLTGPLRQLHDFGGRASRHAFWSWLLLVWLGSVIVAVVVRAVSPGLIVAIVFPGVLVEYLLLWSIAVRRLHDTGRSGWSLLVMFIPLVGLIVLLVWLASASEAGDNQFGPKPG